MSLCKNEKRKEEQIIPWQILNMQLWCTRKCKVKYVYNLAFVIGVGKYRNFKGQQPELYYLRTGKYKQKEQIQGHRINKNLKASSFFLGACNNNIGKWINTE